jgi:hypothetical protein
MTNQWRQTQFGSCNPPQLLPCPTALPEHGSSCGSLGFGVYPTSCPYSTPCGMTLVHCIDTTWTVDACGEGSAAGAGGGESGAAGAGGEAMGGAGGAD